MKRIFILVLSSLILALFGCQTERSIVYHPIMHQGRPLTPKQMQSIKLGLTKSQVEKIIGSPALVAPFNSNIWIYVYSTRQQFRHTKVSPRKLALTFINNRLVKIKH